MTCWRIWRGFLAERAALGKFPGLVCHERGDRSAKGQAPNHRVLLRPKGVVVSDAGKAVPRGRQVGIEKVSESEPPMTHRKERDAVETRSAGRSSDQSEGNLFTAQTAAGV